MQANISFFETINHPFLRFFASHFTVRCNQEAKNDLERTYSRMVGVMRISPKIAITTRIKDKTRAK